MNKAIRLLLWILITAVLLAGVTALFWPGTGNSGQNTAARDRRVLEWIYHPERHPDWVVEAGQRCGTAPFLLPSSGFIGYLWDDSFRPGHRHQGIDLFSGTQSGETAVLAAADGYLTRLADWKSSVILRIPQDPFDPSRQIWLYYTHMADASGYSLIHAAFPPGVSEIFVRAGDLIGYQGNYSGTAGQPVGVHLHFSIVLDDGQGKFLNELAIENTLDPSSYLGITLNAQHNPANIPLCPPTSAGVSP
jgi:peptidoglycan LD-endopeptidase LytH